MLNFIITWIIATLGVKYFLYKKNIKTPFNDNVVSLVLSFIIVAFLNIIQLIFDFILKIILR